MPLTQKPSCLSCKTTNSTIWRKSCNGDVFCSTCARKEIDGFNETQPSEDQNKNGHKDVNQSCGPVRKSARIKPSRYKYQSTFKPLATKGKNRRVIFKKNPIKAAPAVATVITSDYIFYDGHYWQVGDIASVMDDDGGIYYVQLRGFLQDQYCEKSAVITWLLPTSATIRKNFDPATYIIGPEEDLPRPMSCFQFVMHAPSDYFYDKSSPFPTVPKTPELGYISTHLGPEIRKLPPPDQRYGLCDLDSAVTDSSQEKVKSKQDTDKRKKHEPKERKRGRISKAKEKLNQKPAPDVKQEPRTGTGTEKRKGRERHRPRGRPSERS